MGSCAHCGWALKGTERFCSSCGNQISEDESNEVVLDTMLPISANYDKVVKVNIENPSAIKITKTDLDFYPYYVFEYTVDVQRKDPSGKRHNLEDQGILIIDAFRGKLISDKGRRFMDKLNTFFSTKESSSISFDSITERQIIQDLSSIDPVRNYRLDLTGNYAINIIEDKVSLPVIEKAVLRKIAARNTLEISYNIKKSKYKTEERIMKIVPRHHDIEIKRKSLVYIPIWTIMMRSGGSEYKRRVLAASGTFLMDEIASCSKHFSFPSILNRQKQTVAVCNICGGAFCTTHINRVDQMYYCKQHLPNMQ